MASLVVSALFVPGALSGFFGSRKAWTKPFRGHTIAFAAQLPNSIAPIITVRNVRTMMESQAMLDPRKWEYVDRLRLLITAAFGAMLGFTNGSHGWFLIQQHDRSRRLLICVN
jgi:hypothetical protein